MCQTEVLLQREDGREVVLRVANHTLKSTLERLGGVLEGEHIHG